MRVAADVLGEADVVAARGRLADALLERSGATNAARVQVQPDGRTAWFRTGPAPDVPPERMPTPADMRRHPLFRYHCDTGFSGPVLLADLPARGYALDAGTRRVIDELGITAHQLSVPVEVCGPQRGYDGWMLVGTDALPASAVPELSEAQPLLRGLDRHLRLLGELVPTRSGPLLTPRETVVLAMLSCGSTAEGIAARLLISPRTVHKHQEHLYRKLGAVDRLSAVLRGQELGLLPRGTARAPDRGHEVPEASQSP